MAVSTGFSLEEFGTVAFSNCISWFVGILLKA
jgi:hypothetical protein